MKNFLILITLFLILNNANTGLLSEDKVVSYLQHRNDIAYEVNAIKPFTGKFLITYANGQKEAEGSYKNGKEHGLATKWHKNGQKNMR